MLHDFLEAVIILSGLLIWGYAVQWVWRKSIRVDDLVEAHLWFFGCLLMIALPILALLAPKDSPPLCAHGHQLRSGWICEDAEAK